jgi:hypothetical protein
VIATRLLPKFFKDVLQHIPTLALKSLNWKEVLKSMGPMILRMGNYPLDNKERDSLVALNIPNINIVNRKLNLKGLDELSQEELYARGQNILKIYFAQLQNANGLNLDLRYKYFDYSNSELNWAPNNVWYNFSDNFRLALINIYKGFYFKDNSLFRAALKNIGLSKNLNPEQTIQLEKLFNEHFGPGEQELVKFELEKFSESFYELFHFFVEEEVELDKDFIFLGIYLVTLYMHLEELDTEFNVKEAFNAIFSS